VNRLTSSDKGSPVIVGIGSIARGAPAAVAPTPVPSLAPFHDGAQKALLEHVPMNRRRRHRRACPGDPDPKRGAFAIGMAETTSPAMTFPRERDAL